MITKQKTNQINKNPTDFKASDLKEKHEIAASIQKVTSRRAIIFFINKTSHFLETVSSFYLRNVQCTRTKQIIREILVER